MSVGSSGRIQQISNELEFCLENISAPRLIGYNGLPIIEEVNPEHVIELNVSLANDVDELNQRLAGLVGQLVENGRFLGGEIYAGSSLLADTREVEPARYRTTCLSESCARGFLDITSQQVVIGVTGEEFGIELFNYLRTINPVLLALSCSSPYQFEEGQLVDTGFLSRRIGSYREICQHFPREILESRELSSREDFERALQLISDRVNDSLEKGELDENQEELYRIRNGNAYAPFRTLEPHQIYWMTRFRPDHQNERSDFSIEMRVADAPTTVQRMQMLNSFVIGLCYYAQEFGVTSLPSIEGKEFVNLEIAARYGPRGIVGGISLSDHIGTLRGYAIAGLQSRGCETERLVRMTDRVLTEGTDADLIRRQEFQHSDELRDYLIARLSEGE